MSSIRPLATITVLALVGVFLYLKINETEPPLPEGVEDWSADTALQFDMSGADPSATSEAAPQFGVAPTASEAPAFSAEPAAAASATATATATATAAPPAGDTAPAFNPHAATSPALEAPSFEAVKTEVVDAVASTLPDLPPMPALPEIPSTTPTIEEIVAEVPAAAYPQATLPGVPVMPEMPVTAAPVTPQIEAATQAEPSLFSATRLKVQAALDRGELSQALLLLSDWYGDPSLSASEASEVESLLGQLAGSVIYSTEHRLEPPYMVQAGEQLETIAKKYDVPWQLLAKINGLGSADQLQPGQQLKVMQGPFSALIDISQRKMTVMLGRRYAGRFTLDFDSQVTVEEGHWEVNQKLLTPANVSLPGSGPTTPSEERSLMLSNVNGGATKVAILRGATAPNRLAATAGREMRMNPTDAKDAFDILSLGSKVVIRR